ncbi:hypothetical protein IG631_21049 [Alternaria alternata]|nr:hypothetical protein IG631_21049 [Alternaria alternata]
MASDTRSTRFSLTRNFRSRSCPDKPTCSWGVVGEGGTEHHVPGGAEPGPRMLPVGSSSCSTFSDHRWPSRVFATKRGSIGCWGGDNYCMQTERAELHPLTPCGRARCTPVKRRQI